MANLARHHDIDLPIVTGLDVTDLYVARTLDDLYDAANAEQDYLLRPIDVEGPPTLGLAEILKHSAKELQSIASAPNVALVEYEWCLAPRSVLWHAYPRTRQSRHTELVPHGYQLAAKAKIVKNSWRVGASTPAALEVALEAIREYEARPTDTHPLRIRDATHAGQFLAQAGVITYIDIEPRLTDEPPVRKYK